MKSAAMWLLVVAALGAGACSSENDAETAATSAPLAPPSTWDEVDSALDGVAASTALVAAEVSPDGTLDFVHDRSPDAIGPIGGAFAVYVLGMTSDRVGGGDLAWSDELVDPNDGSAVTVAEAARRMIGDGDRPMMDLLIDTVGRDNIEILLPAMNLGEEALARTLPVITSRERTILLTSSVDDRRRYATADADTRRELLGEVQRVAETADADGVGESSTGSDGADLDAIGWFASPSELARAQLWIDSQRGLPGQEALEDIVTARGAPEGSEWTRYASTAGTQADTAAVTWLVDRADGRRFVVSIVTNSWEENVNPADIDVIAAGIIGLLAEQ